MCPNDHTGLSPSFLMHKINPITINTRLNNCEISVATAAPFIPIHGNPNFPKSPLRQSLYLGLMNLLHPQSEPCSVPYQSPLFYILIIWYNRNMDFTKVKRITRYKICVCFLLYLHNKRIMYLYTILTSTILLF